MLIRPTTEEVAAFILRKTEFLSDRMPTQWELCGIISDILGDLYKELEEDSPISPFDHSRATHLIGEDGKFIMDVPTAAQVIRGRHQLRYTPDRSKCLVFDDDGLPLGYPTLDDLENLPVGEDLESEEVSRIMAS